MILSAAANGLFTLFCVFVGVRLLLLARRTRALPEFLIGFAFANIGLVGFPLMAASGFGQVNVGEVKLALLAGGEIALGISVIAVFSFTWRVFRPGSGWAAGFTALTSLGVAVMVGMTIHQIASSPQEMSSLEAGGAWTSALRLPYGVWYGWTAYESLRCYAMGRRRLAIGLGDPVVVNRFLVWGCMGVLETLANIGALIPEMQGLSPFRNTAGALIMAANGLVGTGLMFLTFMPPKAYLSLVRQRASIRQA